LKLKKLIFLSVIILNLILCSNTWALLAGPELFGMDFRFNNPGARSSAMGGAFIGLADDATAAYTNPAGLTILSEPEVSLELKHTRLTNKVYSFQGSDEFEDDVFDTSFFSFAYPKKDSTITLYRHRLVNVESNFEWRESVTRSDKIDFDMDVVTTGIGMGFKVSETLSMGLSVGFAHLEYYSLDDKYDMGVLDSFERVNDEDSAEHYTVSFLWNLAEKLNVGLVYRYGPEFRTTKSRWEDTGAGVYELQYNLESELKIPDAYGLGLAYRFSPSFTAALDANYVEYSDLTDNFELEPASPQNGSDFEVDDAVEVHVGLEYVVDLETRPLALRMGYFYRPDHRIKYVGPDATFREILKDRGDHEHIFSVGFGTLLSEDVQLDISASTSEYIKEGSFSMVYRY